MKITKSQLKRIIKEELSKVIFEMTDSDNDGIDDKRELAVIDRGELTDDEDAESIDGIQAWLKYDYKVPYEASRGLAQKMHDEYGHFGDYEHEYTAIPEDEVIAMAAAEGIAVKPVSDAAKAAHGAANKKYWADRAAEDEIRKQRPRSEYEFAYSGDEVPRDPREERA